MNRNLLLVFFLLSLVLQNSCASSGGNPLEKLLAAQQYDRAAAILEERLQNSPKSIDDLLALAQVRYHQGDFDATLNLTAAIRTLEPVHSNALLLEGLVYEKQEKRAEAIEVYSHYTQLGRLDPKRRQFQARLSVLVSQQIEEETRLALAREGLSTIESIPQNTIAVAPFVYVGQNENLRYLQKGLAYLLTRDLSKVRALQVVSRLRTQALLTELGLGQTGLVDTATAPRFGHLLGARNVVIGNFLDTAADRLRLEMEAADIATGTGVKSEESGSQNNILRTYSTLTLKLIGAMGIVLSDEERRSIQELPTEQLLAFIAFSKGLDLEDRGLYQEAAAAYEEALEQDPSFDLASENFARMQGISLHQKPLGRWEIQALGLLDVPQYRESTVLDPSAQEPTTSPSGTAESAAPKTLAKQTAPASPPGVLADPDRGTLTRLIKTGSFTGAGFIPVADNGENNVRKPAEALEDPTTTPGGTPTPAQTDLEIEIILPQNKPTIPQKTGN